MVVVVVLLLFVVVWNLGQNMEGNLNRVPVPISVQTLRKEDNAHSRLQMDALTSRSSLCPC